MKHSFLLIALALVVFSTSCTKSDTPEETTTPAAETATRDLPALLDELVGTDWKLVSIGGQKVAEDPAVNMLFLEDGRVAGNGPVNHYNGIIKVEDGALKIGPLAAMLKAGPQDAMDRESTYFKALESAVSLTRDGDTLTLTTTAQNGTLVFSERDNGGL